MKKTEIRNNTAKVTKLLRGIDNETAAIAKSQEALNKRVANVKKNAAEISTLVSGISGAALTPSADTPAKKTTTPVKKTAAKKTAIPAKKTVAPAKKTVAPVKNKKEVSPAKKEATGARPPLKDVISDILRKATTPQTTADIYKQVVAEVGYFSRQSVYSALKDSKLYAKTGDVYQLKDVSSSAPAVSDEEIDEFVDKATNNQAVAAVT